MFTSQRVLTLLCGILLTGSVVFYFYKQNTSLQKPIKIYKTTSPQTQSPSSVTTPHEHTHNHTYNSSVHESPPYTYRKWKTSAVMTSQIPK